MVRPGRYAPGAGKLILGCGVWGAGCGVYAVRRRKCLVCASHVRAGGGLNDYRYCRYYWY